MAKGKNKFVQFSIIALLIVLPMGLFAVLHWVWWYHDPRSDGLDKAMRGFAGWPAIDCGSVPINGRAADADTCVVSAFEAHRPFIARYEEEGTDSIRARAIAGTSKGLVCMFHYDRGSAGGSEIIENIWKEPCPELSCR